MPRYRVAHIKEQNVNLIIVPLDASFGQKTNEEMNAVTADLQEHASSAGLAGTVVPVWDNGAGQMAFMAPSNFQPFFKGIGLNQVMTMLNKEIYW
jgi:hypothetical protein